MLAGAGCSASSGSDTPALNLPSGTGASTQTGTFTGPTVSVVRVDGIPVPQLPGLAVADVALKQVGAGLTGTCSVSTERDDQTLASFLWTCGTDRVSAATVWIPKDQVLTLGDLFTGSYQSYLAATASAQLQASGATDPSTSSIRVWALTPDALEAFYPSGEVSFPIPSLASYLRRPGPLTS